MRRICITYRMDRKGDSAERCITLPMEDRIAKELFQNRGEAQTIKPGGQLWFLLNHLCGLQGYAFTEAVYLEDADKGLGNVCADLLDDEDDGEDGVKDEDGDGYDEI